MIIVLIIIIIMIIVIIIIIIATCIAQHSVKRALMAKEDNDIVNLTRIFNKIINKSAVIVQTKQLSLGIGAHRKKGDYSKL